MTEQTTKASFERVADIPADSPTLIEGLPGHGLVAAIAVDQITDQLGLEHCGNITSGRFPGRDVRRRTRSRSRSRFGRIRSGSDDLRERSRASATGVRAAVTVCPRGPSPTNSAVRSSLRVRRLKRKNNWVTSPASRRPTRYGTISSTRGFRQPTTGDSSAGSPAHSCKECYQADVPAALLIVRSHPYLPDPEAAKSVIETALEPLVDFDIDTTALDEQADDIQQRMQQVAQQYQQVTEEGEDQQQQVQTGMFQ